MARYKVSLNHLEDFPIFIYCHGRGLDSLIEEQFKVGLIGAFSQPGGMPLVSHLMYTDDLGVC